MLHPQLLADIITESIPELTIATNARSHFLMVPVLHELKVQLRRRTNRHFIDIHEPKSPEYLIECRGVAL